MRRPFDGKLLWSRDLGVVNVNDAATGKELWRLRSGGDNPIPTPFAADGLIYVANGHGGRAPVFAVRPSASGDISLKDDESSEEGDVFVVRAGPTFELLAHNCMGESCLARAAISEGTLFFRTRRHIVAIGQRG